MTAPAETEVKDPGSECPVSITCSGNAADRSWRLGFFRPGKCVGDERFFSLRIDPRSRVPRNESAPKRREKRNDRRVTRDFFLGKRKNGGTAENLR